MIQDDELKKSLSIILKIWSYRTRVVDSDHDDDTNVYYRAKFVLDVRNTSIPAL